MSILDDIKKVTEIPVTDRPSSSSFICYSIPERTPKKNRHAPPRNANLYTEDCNEAGDNKQQCNESPKIVHESEIACSIEQVYAGINYSNESIEDKWKARQIEATLNCLTKTDSNPNNSCNETDGTEGEEYLLRKCKLHKNAAIRGLLKTHKISLHDLQIPNKSGDIEEKKCRETHIQNENTSTINNVTEEKYPMKLVPYPEDPEVFVQPIHAYGKLDENDYKDIDFTVPRIGKKREVTSRQYYTRMDETGFNFVKKNAKGKK